MIVKPYSDGDSAAWNELVSASRAGTFLFHRGYMDYHRDRFPDHSLLFYSEGGTLQGALPATRGGDAGVVSSHAGLTYGGLILRPEVRLTAVGEMLRAAARHYLSQGFERLAYKPVPFIYYSYPSDDDRYYLFRADARLTARSASTAIDLTSPHAAALWHRKLKAGAAQGLKFKQLAPQHVPAFWRIVEQVLATYHATRPVHTAAQMQLLMQQLPLNIALYAMCNEGDEICAGSIVYHTPTCAHVQYMEASPEGRKRRALDQLIRNLSAHCLTMGHTYLDFGISTERGGTYLNEGLVYQKEGFGGRTVCYDEYEVSLQRLAAM